MYRRLSTGERASATDTSRLESSLFRQKHEFTELILQVELSNG